MFKNYDNGWKWLKMMGMVSFVAMIVLLVSESVGFADIGINWKNYTLELVIMAAGLAAYIVGKIMNCNVELLAITQAKSLKDVEPWMEN